MSLVGLFSICDTDVEQIVLFLRWGNFFSGRNKTLVRRLFWIRLTQLTRTRVSNCSRVTRHLHHPRKNVINEASFFCKKFSIHSLLHLVCPWHHRCRTCPLKVLLQCCAAYDQQDLGRMCLSAIVPQQGSILLQSIDDTSGVHNHISMDYLREISKVLSSANNCIRKRDLLCMSICCSVSNTGSMSS